MLLDLEEHIDPFNPFRTVNAEHPTCSQFQWVALSVRLLTKWAIGMRESETFSEDKEELAIIRQCLQHRYEKHSSTERAHNV